MPGTVTQILRPDAPPVPNPRPIAVLPNHPGDYRLAEAVNYGKQIAIWNIEEIMNMADDEETLKAVARKKKKTEEEIAGEALQRRREEARVLAQYERMLGRLVMIEQKLVASQTKGKNYVDARRRAFERINAEIESERQGQG